MGSILKSKLFWVVAALLLLFGLYFVLGKYAAPRLVRSQAVDFVREKYGRELTLGAVSIDPLRLQVDLRDLSLPDTDGKAMLAFRRLFIDFEASSLWQRAFVFKDVQLEAPLARAVIRPDGSVNLADLALPDEEEDEDEPLPQVWIQHFLLGDGTVQFADQARRVPIERQLTPVNLELRDFRTTPEGGDFGLSAKTQNAELLEWKGRFALEPKVSSAGDFAVSRLHLPGALEVAGVELPFEIPQAEMNLQGSYRFALGEPMELEVKLPQMQVSDMTLRARGTDQDLVKIPAIVISDTRIAMPANTVTLGTLAVEGVRTEVWTLPDGSLNIDRLFAADPAAAATPTTAPPPAPAKTPAPAPVPPARGTGQAKASTAPAPAAEQPWTVTVASIALRDAFVSYEDRALQPVARFELSPLNVTATDASLDLGQPLAVAFDASINGAGKLKGSGKVVPEPFAADLDIDLAGFRVQDLQPYANGTTDLTLRDGTVGASGRFALAPPQSGRPELQLPGQRDHHRVQVDRQCPRAGLRQLPATRTRPAQVRAGAGFAEHRAGAGRAAVCARDRQLGRDPQRVGRVRSAGHGRRGRRGPRGEGGGGNRVATQEDPRRGQGREEGPREGRGGRRAGAQARRQPAAGRTAGDRHADPHPRGAGGRRHDGFRRLQRAAQFRGGDRVARRQHHRPFDRSQRARRGQARRQRRRVLAGADRRRDPAVRLRPLHRHRPQVREHLAAGLQPVLGQVRRLQHRQGQTVHRPALPHRPAQARRAAQDPHRPARMGRGDGRQGGSHAAGEVRDLAAQGRRRRDRARHPGERARSTTRRCASARSSGR